MLKLMFTLFSLVLVPLYVSACADGFSCFREEGSEIDWVMKDDGNVAKKHDNRPVGVAGFPSACSERNPQRIHI